MNDTELRRRAEERLRRRQAIPADAEMAKDWRLLHELEVHQIELEIINEELAINEERMWQAIEASDQALWDYDVEAGRVHLSDTWSWLLGGERGPTDITMRELIERVVEADRPMVQAAIAQALNGTGATEYRVTHRVAKADGSFFWVRADGKVVQRAPDGRALRMTGLIRDVTEHMHLENELRSREARYRAVIDAAVDGFWIIDMAGHFLEVNDIYIRQSGYSRDELLKMRVSDLEARERPGEVAAHQREIKRAGHDRFESEHRRKDGSVWPVEIEVTYSAALDLSFVFVVDATERKRTEREIQLQRRELEALQKSQVAAHTAAVFAHELNQPLGAIASYSEAALMMLGSERPDLGRLRDAIQNGRDQALRAGDAIRELLALQGSDFGVADALDLNHEIRSVLALARRDTELHFRARLDLEQMLPAVRASRVHIKKVLLNLVHNAVEAMRDAKVVKPAIVVSVRTRTDEGLAQVTVQDNGPGIKAHDAARLFESFFTTKEGGIGMGLAISRSLVEANGGQLWCDPGEGPGATFHLTLPFVE